MKSDLLAHQDLSVWTSGGEERGEGGKEEAREANLDGNDETNQNDSRKDEEKKRVKSQTPRFKAVIGSEALERWIAKMKRTGEGRGDDTVNSLDKAG